jgi:hypothetical protein
MDRIEPHLLKPIMDYKSNPHPASADAVLKASTPSWRPGSRRTAARTSTR